MVDMRKLFKKSEKLSNKANTEYNNKLINEIHDVCRQIAQTELWFQMECDNDLIEACIHQREVLQSKYRYLVSKARENNVYIEITPENIFSI